MNTLWQDLRYSARMLIKSPGFTFITIITLMLGIGANTAMFSLVDALLLKSLPVQKPDRLVLFGKGKSAGLTNGFPNGSTDLFAYPFYEHIRQNNDSFTDVAALLSMSWSAHGTINGDGTSGEPELMNVQPVSGNYFAVLGVNAGLGRVFTDDDDRTNGAHPVAVVSYGWWARRLGGNPSAIGQTITMDQTTFTIIGVGPKEFFGTTVGQAPDVWVPLAMQPQLPPAHWDGRTDWSFQDLNLIGRLKDGVNITQASAAVNVAFKQFLQQQSGAQLSPERAQNIERANVELTPAGKGLSDIRRQFSMSLIILMAIAGVVLMIACANIANLLLSRAASRQREFAVRLAVGAGRMRLVRQLLTESIMLAGLGGTAAVFLAWWGSSLVVWMASDSEQALPVDVTPNLRILSFALLASVLSAAIFGSAPALRAARVDPYSELKGGKGAGQAASHSRLGKALVVVQVALSLVLLVGAGLFVRTLINLQNVPTGFNEQNVMLFRMDTSTAGLKDEEMGPLLREVEERVEAVPGVQASSFSFFIFNQGGWTSRLFSRELDTSQGENRIVRQNTVGADFFETMGIPLLAGRGFGPQDTDKSQRVAIISETMAQRYFPNRSPLGKRFGTSGPQSTEQNEIIGVVKDARYGDLTEQWQPMAYYSHAQRPQPLENFVVRFAGPPESIVPQVRQAIQQVNRNLPVDEVVSVSEHISRSLVQQKLIARLASFFGLLALLLACVGLYGVLSYAVTRRTGEIGIRIALGARSGNVLWLVSREALILVSIGIVIGLAASLLATQAAASLLFGLKPNDPLTIGFATLLLAAVALAACYIPARRATKVDPMVALRYE